MLNSEAECFIDNHIAFCSTALARGENFLFNEEKDYINNSVSKRKTDFATGRWCARRALEIAGVPAGPIQKGEYGQPIWPEGIAGSISHTTNYYCAAVSKHHISLGIDAEKISNILTNDMICHVCTDNELINNNILGDNSDQIVRHLIFSAKEAFYKCVFPIVNKIFDFKDVELSIDHANSMFTVTVLIDLSTTINKGDTFTGQYWCASTIVLTLVTIDKLKTTMSSYKAIGR